MMMNSGQSCNAPTRLIVPEKMHDQVAQIAKGVAEGIKHADPMTGPPGSMGPVVSKAQWEKIQRLIQSGIDEGATLVAGGTGRPEGFNRGYYVKPTIFANVRNDMTIAREEIFGPVLSILKYKDLEDAIRIGNDTQYGLAGYVQSADHSKGQAVAKRIRAGHINVNQAGSDFNAPFGGYKHSGNGREWGSVGFEEFLEVKTVLGFGPKAA
jgi:aldehyde dehydrogenase (NAD+)